MRIKKILAAVIAGIMMIGCVNISYAEKDTEISKRTKEGYEILTALGFLNTDYDEEYISQKKDEEVTRAYFAEFIYKIFCKDITGSDNAYFYDVPNTHYAFRAISALAEMNIISASDDKMFNPDRAITRSEAAKMLLYAIGYGTVTEFTGGWERGINKMAADVDLYDGVKSADKLTFSDMLVITYNSLFVEILDGTGLKNGNMVMEAAGDTYLSKYYDVYMEKDIVLGYDGVGIYGDDVDIDEALIGSRKLDANGFDLTDYLGNQVKYLYHYDEDTEESELLWISKTGRTDELFLTHIDDDAEYNSGRNQITYYDAEKKRTKYVNLELNANVILNGSYVKDDVISVLESDFYSIKLIATEGQGYNLAIIESYENYEVVANDTDKEEVYLKSCDNSTGTTAYISFKLGDYDTVKFTDARGNETAQNVLSAGKIVSVFDTPDKTRIKLVLCDTVVNGEIKAISSNDNYTVLKIDDDDYTLYKSDIVVRATTGAVVEAKLDAFGLVALLKTTSGGVSFGYMLRAFLTDEIEGRYSDTLVVKMFTEEGETVRLAAPEKRIMIDGVTYKSQEVAYDELGGASLKAQLVAYSLNNNGEIKMIDRAEAYGASTPTPNNMLQIVQEKVSVNYNNWTKNLGPKARVGSTTLVFGLPSNAKEARETEYSVGNINTFTHDEGNTVSVFNYGTEYNEFSDVVILHDKVIGNGGWLSNKFVVDSMRRVLNDDDEVVIETEGYHGNIKKTIRFTEKATAAAEKLDRGDIFEVTSRIIDDIDAFNLLYSPHSPQTRPSNTNYSVSGPRITMYYVHDIIGSSILVGNNSGEDFDEMLTPGAMVLVYDTDDDILKEGSIADIKSYKAVGNDCSSLFVYYNGGEVRNFVVIN